MSEIVKRHYDQLLADVYTWMYGGFDAQYSENLKFFKEQGIIPSGKGTALDLGAGSGFQTLALNDLGFDVLSVDISDKLCSELGARSKGRKIEVYNSDILSFLEVTAKEFEAIVCMGDTITHFDSKEDIYKSIRLCSEKTAPGGSFILSFRDYSVELSGVSRFIPVRSDAEKIFTCFVEYAPEKVYVHDILNIRISDKWEHKISVYPKLRLSVDWMKGVLESNGLRITWSETTKGFVRLIARKV